MDRFEFLNLNRAAETLKITPEDSRANWSKRSGISRVSEHSKIIDEGNFTKIGANQGL